MTAGYKNDLWRFDTILQHWFYLSVSGKLPPARENIAITSVNDTLYVFGGNTNSGTKPCSLISIRKSPLLSYFSAGYYGDLWSINVMSGTIEWVQMSIGAACPEARAGHGFVSVKNSLFVFGGQGVEGASAIIL